MMLRAKSTDVKAASRADDDVGTEVGTAVQSPTADCWTRIFFAGCRMLLSDMVSVVGGSIIVTSPVNRTHWDPLQYLIWHAADWNIPRLDYFVQQCKPVGAVLGFDLKNVNNNSIQDIHSSATMDGAASFSSLLSFLNTSKQPSQQQTSSLPSNDAKIKKKAYQARKMCNPTLTPFEWNSIYTCFSQMLMKSTTLMRLSGKTHR
jgi:hypothetical protein